MHCLLRHGIIINFPQAIGSSIPTNELVSSNGKVVKKRCKASSFTVEISDAEMDIDLDEFPELSNEEESHISDNLIPPDSERMITQDEKSNSDFYKSKCVKKESEKERNESSPFVYNRMSKRTRHIPKVFTADGNEDSRYCFCQKEDCGWYLVCSFQTTGCLIYCH